MKIKFIESNHYQRFSYFNSNRNLDENHVKRLMYSIELNGLLEEITINEKWQIIDGQHRFEALKRLNLPVYAKIKIGASEDDIIPCNIVRRGWTIKNYVNHYASKGIADYTQLQEVMDNNTTKLGSNTLVDIYCDTSYRASTLREGRYQFNHEKGKQLQEMISEIEPYMPLYSNTSKFVKALTQVVKSNEKFNIKRFVSQLQKYKLNVYPNTTDTAKSIVEVYNRRLNEKNRIFNHDK